MSTGFSRQKIGRETHEPTRIPRRLVDVDDARLRLGGGVHRKVRAAGDPLVGAGCAEAFSVSKARALDYLQLEAIGHDLAPSPDAAGVAVDDEKGMIGHGWTFKVAR